MKYKHKDCVEVYVVSFAETKKYQGRIEFVYDKDYTIHIPDLSIYVTRTDKTIIGPCPKKLLTIKLPKSSD